MNPLHDRVRSLQARIQRACESSNRDPGSVELLPVSKRQPILSIRLAAELGFQTFGENYVQEGVQKALALPELGFALLGPLQRNKAKPALIHFREILTIDRSSLALRLSHLAEELDLSRRVWVQADLWGETTKLGGCPPGEIPELIQFLVNDSRLQLVGFMAIPPPENCQAFRDMAALREDWQQRLGRSLRLSMGMSGDLEDAIAAGTDQVRVGTDFFGERP